MKRRNKREANRVRDGHCDSGSGGPSCVPVSPGQRQARLSRWRCIFWAGLACLLWSCGGTGGPAPAKKEESPGTPVDGESPSSHTKSGAKPAGETGPANDSAGLKEGLEDSLARQDGEVSPDSPDGPGLKDSATHSKTSVAKPGKTNKPTPPLICVADPGTMEGMSERGEYLLTGDVKCRYGKLEFETGRAVWNRNRNEVICHDGIEVRVDGSVLDAEQGGYRQGQSTLWARRKVTARDSSGSYQMEGESLEYNMDTRWMTMTQRPTLKKIFNKNSVGSKDIAAEIGSKEATSSPKKSKALQGDTLSFAATRIEYNDSLGLAKARRKVTIRRGNLMIRCEKSLYDEKAQRLTLEEDPVAMLKGNELKGDRMWISLDGEKVTGISLKDSTRAFYQEKDNNDGPLNTYNLRADSMFMKIRDEVMEYVELIENGRADHLKEAHPGKKNEMEGDYLRLNFVNEKIDSALVRGRAETSFYIFEKQQYKGRSLADGDSIDFRFDDGKVVEVLIRGGAKGIYQEASVAADSTERKEQ